LAGQSPPQHHEFAFGLTQKAESPKVRAQKRGFLSPHIANHCKTRVLKYTTEGVEMDEYKSA